MAPRSLSAQLCEAFTPLSRFEGPLLSQAPALNHSRLEPKWLRTLSLSLSCGRVEARVGRVGPLLRRVRAPPTVLGKPGGEKQQRQTPGQERGFSNLPLIFGLRSNSLSLSLSRSCALLSAARVRPRQLRVRIVYAPLTDKGCDNRIR